MNGGTTPGRGHARVGAVRAAMEPADERRDDQRMVGHVRVRQPGRNGARR